MSPHLNPSKLGRLEHWDETYDIEKENFRSNPLDEGQVWFDESDAESRILRFLRSQNIRRDANFLDIGTGNGHMLFELQKNDGYSGNLIGIDYSLKAIELAHMIANERCVAPNIKFEIADIIQDDILVERWAPKGGFDVILDKGTYDAISLSELCLLDGRRSYEDYPRRVASALKPGGLLIVVSCNWTEDELKRKILEQKNLVYRDRISYPSFSFGGNTGQTLSSVCFEKI